jgi:16S rRNA (guanine527-N7)-methyltransferase
MNKGSGAKFAAADVNLRLSAARLRPLLPEAIEKFDAYLALILRWNARTNLTAVRDAEGIIGRHFVESIACAQLLPEGIASLLDFGSGAGFPGIPIAICRPEIQVALAESQNKKAAFLQEASRTLNLSFRVFAGRAETMNERFDCVAMRAVDRMEEAVSAAAGLVGPAGWLAVMTTLAEIPAIESADGDNFSWSRPLDLPGSDQRVLLLGRKQAAQP